MSEREFINNIDEIVKRKLKELKLKPKPKLSLRLFKENKKRFYATPCKTEQDEMVFLKLLITREKKAAIGLKRDAEFTKFLSKSAETKKALNIPLFVAAGIKEFPYWFLHQYIPGPLIGHHFKIYKEGLKQGIRKKVIDNLLALQSISYKRNKGLLLKIPLKEKGIRNYLDSLKNLEHKMRLQKRAKEIDFKKIYRFSESQKSYFKRDNLVLAHGDFTLANFFVHNNKVYLNDWEHVCLDNIAADISKLWIQTYKYPVWRSKLILYFLSKLPVQRRKDFKKGFRMLAILEALNEFVCDLYISSKDSLIKKATRETIESALKGFDFLITL